PLVPAPPLTDALPISTCAHPGPVTGSAATASASSIAARADRNADTATRSLALIAAVRSARRAARMPATIRSHPARGDRVFQVPSAVDLHEISANYRIAGRNHGF